MGIYDTIMFKVPIKCKLCGTPIASTQTKKFNPILRTYYVGDILETGIITGVVEEELFCPNYKNHPQPPQDLQNQNAEVPENSLETEYLPIQKIPPQNVYLVVWHKILISIEETYEAAYQKITTFGIGDLFLIYEDLYVKQQTASSKFNRIKHWTSTYLKYLSLSEEDKSRIQNKELALENIQYYDILKYIGLENPFEEYLKDLEKEKPSCCDEFWD